MLIDSTDTSLRAFLLDSRLRPLFYGQGAALVLAGGRARVLTGTTPLSPVQALSATHGTYAGAFVCFSVGGTDVRLRCAQDARKLASVQPFTAWRVVFSENGAEYSDERCAENAKGALLETDETGACALEQNPLLLLNAACFAAQTGFSCGEKLKDSVRQLSSAVARLSIQQTSELLQEFVLSEHADAAFADFSDLFYALFPQMPALGNPFSPQRRMLKALCASECEIVLRTAIFLRPLAAHAPQTLAQAVGRFGLTPQQAQDAEFLLGHLALAGLSDEQLKQSCAGFDERSTRLLLKYFTTISGAPAAPHADSSLR